MRRPLSIPPISAREARISILATVLSNYLVRNLALTTMLTWRGWSEKPAWLWRPFTILTLVVAATAALFWPYLGGSRLYEAVFGGSYFLPTPPHLESHGLTLTYATLCYIVWSLVLLPHTLARLGVLIYRHLTTPRNETRLKDA